MQKCHKVQLLPELLHDETMPFLRFQVHLMLQKDTIILSSLYSHVAYFETELEPLHLFNHVQLLTGTSGICVV